MPQERLSRYQQFERLPLSHVAKVHRIMEEQRACQEAIKNYELHVHEVEDARDESPDHVTGPYVAYL